MKRPYLSLSRNKPGPASLLFKRVSLENSRVMRTKTVAERRDIQEKIAELRPIRPSILFEEIVVGGVPCEWVTRAGIQKDRVILYFHGGSWAFGSSRTARPYAALLLEQTGFPILTVDYRLAPEHPWPAALEDCHSVYRELLSLGLEGKNIGLLGDSAGGNLCLCLLNLLKQEGAAMPACVCCASPVTDLREDSAVVSMKTDLVYLRHDGEERDIFGLYAEAADRSDPLLSPVTGDLSGLPPILIHSGEDEPISADNIVYARKAYEQGVQVRMKLWRDMFHDFSIVGRTLKESRMSILGFRAFYRKYMQN